MSSILSSRTNVASLFAQRQLKLSTAASANSTERLTTGLRINRASDDAATISLSSLVEGDAKVASSAATNLNNGIAYLSIAEEAVGELKTLLSSMNELSQRASSSSNTKATRAALDVEFQSLRTEYNRIIGDTEYNYADIFTSSNTQLIAQAGYGQNGKIAANLTGQYVELGGSQSFGAGTSYAAGSDVSGLIAEDFNGDGIADLLTSSTTEDRLFVQIGNGNGTFKAPSSYGTPGTTNPRGLRSGDFNNDGLLDVVTFAAGRASVFLGNGDATFRAPSNTVYSGSGFGAVGDFNGDGVTDIAIANTGVINVLIGTGSGSFSAQTSYASSPSFDSTNAEVEAFDLNGDGFLDLATNGTNNEMYVSLGNGNGTFKAGVSYLGYSGPAVSQLAFGDLDGDGDLDVAQAGISGVISIMLNNGNGTFKAFTSYASGSAIAPNLVDINGDGNLDYVATGTSGTSIITRKGNGDGTFQNAINTSIFASGNFSAIVDVNGDFVPDIIMGGGTDTVPYVSIQGAAYANNTKRVQTLATMSIATQAGGYSSAHSTSLSLNYLDAIDSSLHAGLSRFGSAQTLNSVKATILEDAYSQMTNVDVAPEAERLVRAQLKQQGAQLAYQIAGQQDALVSNLINRIKV